MRSGKSSAYAGKHCFILSSLWALASVREEEGRRRGNGRECFDDFGRGAFDGVLGYFGAGAEGGSGEWRIQSCDFC